MPFFSVIIPVYNTEKYLTESINSILNQTFSDIEIIIINDGSTDNSRIICEHYAKIDSRIILVNQSNSGLSKTRNTGINLSKGNFLYFFDSDDLLQIDAFEKIYSIISKLPQIDGVLFSAKTFGDTNGKEKFNYSRGNISKEFNTIDYILLSIKNNFFTPSACLFVSKKDSLLDLRFPENIIHEDLSFYIELMCNNFRTVYVMQDELFSRRLRKNSIMQEKVSQKNYSGYKYAINKTIELSRCNNNSDAYGALIFMLTRKLIKISFDMRGHINFSTRLDLLKIFFSSIFSIQRKVLFTALCLVPEISLTKK